MLVEWEDAYSHEHDQPYEPCTSYTTGYLVRQDKRFLQIAQNYQRANLDYYFPRHMMVIPKAYVREVKVLKKGAMIRVEA